MWGRALTDGKRRADPGEPQMSVLKYAAIAVTTLLLPASACSGDQSQGNGMAAEVIAEARAAMGEAQSYRVEGTATYTVPDGETHQDTFELKHIFPDRHWGKTNFDDGSWWESIASGDRQYARSSDARYWQVLPLESPDPGARSTVVVVSVDGLAFFEKLRDLEILADEEIDGVECFHYRGKPEAYGPIVGVEVELWIGREDRLIRKLRNVTRVQEARPEGEEVWATYTVVGEYHDFNGDIVIPTIASETKSASVGEEFAVRLDVTIRLGQDWYVEHDESILVLTEKEYIPGPEFLDIGGAREFRFRALRAGRTDITCTRKHGGNGPVLEHRIFMVEID